ncbi:MAG: hypothetical protein U0S36_03480 [Candidatus Nanopelagicales bacterium]
MSDEQGKTARELSTLRARRSRVYDSGSWSASVTAVGAGVVAFLAWLAYALRVGGSLGTRAPGTWTFVVLAVAITASTFCAAFGAAYLVLRTIQRDIEAGEPD